VSSRRRLTLPAAALTGAAVLLGVLLATGTSATAVSPHVIWLSPQAFLAGQNIAGGHLSFSSPSGDEQQVTTDRVGDLQWTDYPLQISNQNKILRVITCYKLTSASSFISQVRLASSKVPPTATVVYDDPTDLTSTAGTCHTGMLVAPISVTGEVTLSLRLNFGSTSDAIDIGAVGLVVI
jgi:hypothetical protein